MRKVDIPSSFVLGSKSGDIFIQKGKGNLFRHYYLTTGLIHSWPLLSFRSQRERVNYELVNYALSRPFADGCVHNFIRVK
jgi:hypothetical protein